MPKRVHYKHFPESRRVPREIGRQFLAVRSQLQLGSFLQKLGELQAYYQSVLQQIIGAQHLGTITAREKLSEAIALQQRIRGPIKDLELLTWAIYQKERHETLKAIKDWYCWTGKGFRPTPPPDEITDDYWSPQDRGRWLQECVESCIEATHPKNPPIDLPDRTILKGASECLSIVLDEFNRLGVLKVCKNSNCRRSFSPTRPQMHFCCRRCQHNAQQRRQYRAKKDRNGQKAD